MKVICKKVILLDEILGEETIDIIFEKENKIYQGALFFELDTFNKVKEILKVETFEGADIPVIRQVFNFYLENATKVSDTTISTMEHWQHINGFSPYMISNNKFQLFSETKYLDGICVFTRPVGENYIAFSCGNSKTNEILLIGIMKDTILYSCKTFEEFKRRFEEFKNLKLKLKKDGSILENAYKSAGKLSLEEFEVINVSI